MINNFMESYVINYPCIYTSADSVFFNDYGISFINSFNHFNPTLKIHIHIFDPTEDDLRLLETLPCNYSVEKIDNVLKKESVNNLLSIIENQTDHSLITQINSGLRFLQEYNTLEEKLYRLVHGQNYRSGRFVALNKLWDGQNIILCYDVDTLCTAPISINNVLTTQSQGCLDIKGKFVTSLTAFKNNSQLVRDWGNTLETFMKTNKISFGFMDQNTFIKLADSYNVEKISLHYCNHSKKGGSCVITGKGQKKFGDTFIEKVNLWKK